MIRKEDLKKWATNKWFDDIMAARGAMMDALDGMGKPSGMSSEELRNTEILNEAFWEGDGLENAWQEYLEQRRLDKERVGVAIRLLKRFGEQIAMDYIMRLYHTTYSRFGENIMDRYFHKASKLKESA